MGVIVAVADLAAVPVSPSAADLKATNRAVELIEEARRAPADGKPRALLSPGISRPQRDHGAGERDQADAGQGMRASVGLSLVIAFWANAVNADLWLVGWRHVPGLVEGELAADEWEPQGSAGLSFPNGRHAVITYWTKEDGEGRQTTCCTHYFDNSMRSTGGLRSEPSS